MVEDFHVRVHALQVVVDIGRDHDRIVVENDHFLEVHHIMGTEKEEDIQEEETPSE